MGSTLRGRRARGWAPGLVALGALLLFACGQSAGATSATATPGPSTGAAAGLGPSDPAGGVQGIDASRWQRSVDWTKVRGSGVQFAYLKATEGQRYVDPSFDANQRNAGSAGVLRGAYHFARPDRGGGKDQANHLVNHAGGRKGDGKTLPGALDLEWNPAGPTCYGLSQKRMGDWIWDFVNQYHARAGRWPVIYTPTSWWDRCTGGYGGFAKRGVPLWQTTLGNTPRELARGWTSATFWQYGQTDGLPGIGVRVDRNVFNGSPAQLHALAEPG